MKFSLKIISKYISSFKFVCKRLCISNTYIYGVATLDFAKVSKEVKFYTKVISKYIISENLCMGDCLLSKNK